MDISLSALAASYYNFAPARSESPTSEAGGVKQVTSPQGVADRRPGFPARQSRTRVRHRQQPQQNALRTSGRKPR